MLTLIGIFLLMHGAGERRDLYGDPLPPHAVARLGTIRFRVGEQVDSVGFSPDSKQIFAHAGNQVTIWDAATGKELRRHTLDAHRADTPGFALPVECRFRADGRSMVTVESVGREQVIRIRDLADMKVVRMISAGRLARPLLTPDGKRLIALSEDAPNQVEMWDLDSGKLARVWTTDDPRLFRIELARDGRTVAARGIPDRAIHIWDVEAGRLRRKIAVSAKTAGVFALSPDGKLVVFGDRDNVAAGRLGPLQIYPHDTCLHVWDIDAGKELCQLRVVRADGDSARPPQFFRAIFSPTGTHVVAYCLDGVLRVWDAQSGKLQRERATGHSGTMMLAFAPDGQTLVLAGSTLRRLDWPSLDDKQQEFGHHAAIGKLAITPDGSTVITAGFGPIHVWDAATGRLRHTLSGHGMHHMRLRVLADGRTLMSAGMDDAVRIWSLGTGQEQRRIQAAGVALPIAISDDGALVAWVHEDYSARVIETATGKERLRIPASKELHNPTPSAAFTRGGRTLIVWRPDHSVHVWDVAAAKKVCEFEFAELNLPAIPRPTRQGYHATISPDGCLVAFGPYEGGGYLAIHDVATGKRVRLVDKLTADAALPTAFSPDGRSLAWSDWRTPELRLLEVASGKERLRLRGHSGRVGQVAFSADGRTLASASTDTTALVWDLRGAAAANGGTLDKDAAWNALACDNAATAYAVMCQLTQAPAEAVAIFRSRLKPASQPDEKHLATLLVDLDSNQFQTRDTAQDELTKFEGTAVPAIRAALKRATSLELRRRLNGLLERQLVQEWQPSADRLRLRRAIEVLEMVDSAESRTLLENFATAAPGALLTEEATAALHRSRRNK